MKTTNIKLLFGILILALTAAAQPTYSVFTVPVLPLFNQFDPLGVSVITEVIPYSTDAGVTGFQVTVQSAVDGSTASQIVPNIPGRTMASFPFAITGQPVVTELHQATVARAGVVNTLAY